MDGKYLSDIIDINKDIKPYKLIQIYSGVGSGKNTWVEALAKDGYSILLITSRRATANAQASKLGAFRYYGFKDFPLDNKQLKQSIVVCTNSSFANFVTGQYDPNDPTKHIWKYFDFIILDEAHSLVSDATFLDAPFHVKCFLRWVQENDEHCKIVFMTGTPEPIDSLFSSSTKKSNTYNFLNYYEKCRHVDPKEVILYPQAHVANEIKDQLTKNPDERIIYFANSISHIKSLVADLKARGISEESIGVAYSDNRKNAEFSSELVAKKKRIRDSILEQERIPSDVRVFITTTQNKEGINLNDDDIKIMFAESTQRAELIQMAGRVRKGLECLVILYNTPQYVSYITEFEAIRDTHCCKEVNAALDEFVDSPYMPDDNDGKGIIANVEKSFPNIRFDHMTYKFRIYTGRIRGNRPARQDLNYVEECVRTWCTETPESTKTGQGKGAIDIQKWFPFSECSDMYLPQTEKGQRSDLAGKIRNLLISGSYVGTKILKVQRDTLIAEINKLLLNYNCTQIGILNPIKSLAPFLKKFGYCISQVGKHNGEQFLITTIGGEKQNPI